MLEDLAFSNSTSPGALDRVMFSQVATIQRNNVNCCSTEYLREPSDRSNSIKAYLPLLRIGRFLHGRRLATGGVLRSSCGCFPSFYPLPKRQDGHFGMVQDEVKPLARDVEVNAWRAWVLEPVLRQPDVPPKRPQCLPAVRH